MKVKNLKHIKRFNELDENLNISDVSNNEVDICSFCGSENISIESDGVWCYDCAEWKSTK